jgi:hypothetical protein
VKGVDVIRVGTVTDDGKLTTGSTAVAMSDLRNAHEGWFPAFMG